jgi:hypothetical protein
MTMDIAAEPAARTVEPRTADPQVADPRTVDPQTASADDAPVPDPDPAAEPAAVTVPVEPAGPTEPAAPAVPAPVPTPRPEAETEGEQERGKARKTRKTVRAKSAVGGTKALVVWRDGKLHYADDGVVVVDLDEAASPDLDMHEVVDRLAELREAADSAGRAEAVAALAEIIQDKALN